MTLESFAPLSRFDVARLESVLSRYAEGSARASHLLELANRIHTGDHADPVVMPRDVVTMNSTVILTNVAAGRQFRCTLVFPHAADSSTGAVSVLAPLGAALLGTRVGNTFEVAIPSGSCKYRVDELVFQPEAVRRYDL
ncbi:GreA/GreB family elongation factor [Spiribacter halobius]|uniref:Transcription elongation factor GreAB n=1 Tax=Sediminicurvatus halobius TaxID=2182432 RepID=A0A2U2MWY5_9GAMM|nr:GreA/GreB family elongation factor [Spiribacter halobius]PWG61373.1 transcription elongation factor GreAB [Spiribacter halobius]UEX76587.1 GreA/GreB family elongation factor [Spiribacter halobius]